MKQTIIVIALALTSLTANATRYCTPGRSKPCGKGCIAVDLKCTKNWSTAISGTNPNSGGKKHYEDSEVKHVDTAPSDTQGK